MNKTEIEINGQTYRIGKLNALAQFHVSRRLAPVLAAVGVSLSSLKEGMKADQQDFVTMLEPISQVMAKMTDEETNDVIFTCLAVVSRKQDDRFAPVQNGTQLMFQDIDMPIMLRLVVATLRENLGNFLQELSGVIS